MKLGFGDSGYPYGSEPSPGPWERLYGCNLLERIAAHSGSFSVTVQSDQTMQTVTVLPAGKFFGTVCHSYDAAGVLLRESHHARGQILPHHLHEAPHFCFCLAGGFTEHIHGRERECGPGTLEYHPAGTVHSNRWAAGGGRCFTVTLGDSWSPTITERAPLLQPGVLGSGGRDLIRQLRAELLRPDHCSALTVEGLTLAMLAAAVRDRVPTRGRQEPPWLAMAKEYVHAHAYQSITIRQVACAVGTHPVHLARAFRKAFGMTVGHYVRELRVAKASELLRQSPLPLMVIALECGFADHAHLTRTFQRVLQTTPSAYRKTPIRRTRPEG